MYCSSCGSQNADNAKFCSHCGKPIISGSSPNSLFGKIGLVWANICGYFLFWLSGILALVDIIQLLSGHEVRSYLYLVYPALRIVDVSYGFISGGIAILCILSAISIIKRKRLSVILAPLTNIVNGISAVFFIIIERVVLGPVVNINAFGITLGFVCVGLAVFNYMYFKYNENSFFN